LRTPDHLSIQPWLLTPEPVSYRLLLWKALVRPATYPPAALLFKHPLASASRPWVTASTLYLSDVPPPTPRLAILPLTSAWRLYTNPDVHNLPQHI